MPRWKVSIDLDLEAPDRDSAVSIAIGALETTLPQSSPKVFQVKQIAHIEYANPHKDIASHGKLLHRKKSHPEFDNPELPHQWKKRNIGLWYDEQGSLITYHLVREIWRINKGSDSYLWIKTVDPYHVIASTPATRHEAREKAQELALNHPGDSDGVTVFCTRCTNPIGLDDDGKSCTKAHCSKCKQKVPVANPYIIKGQK